MMNVAVVFLTYAPKDSPRHKYAVQALESIVKNLSFRDGNLAYFLADDGSDKLHIASLQQIFMMNDVQVLGGSNTGHMGYGASYNLSTQGVHEWADFVIPIEDDWELVRPFDISDLVKAFNPSIQCIRLGYLGWTNPIIGQLVQSANQTFFLMDPSSPETHIFAGHPRLETVDFEKRVGPWPEGIKAGWTEMEVCNRFESRVGVAWPLDAGINASQDYCSLFAHIGEEQA